VSRSIEFEPEASLELSHAASWYEDRRSGLGSDFLRAADRTIERLAQQRILGLRIPTLDPASAVRRVAIPRFPYQIVFEVVDEVVRVLAVAHDHQRPRYWGGRSTESE
jgi:plasmid stabilization system protein ParE